MRNSQKAFRRRLCLVVFGTLVLPPTLWSVTLMVLPTDYARRSIAERLSTSSGRPVTLGKVGVGFLGGVTLGDLRIGAPGNAETPWLILDKASIDVSMLQLLFGKIEPTRIEVVGLNLRIYRRDDGNLELADLIIPESADSQRSAEESSVGRDRIKVEVVVSNAKITIIDDYSGTKLEFTGVQGRGVCDGTQSRLQELRGECNGGTVELATQVDRSGKEPVFEGQFRSRDVALDSGMKALAYLAPVFSGMNANLDGKLNLDFYLKGEGHNRALFLKSLTGHGRIDLDPLVLDGSKLLEQLGRVVEVSPRGRVGAVRADIAVRNGRVNSDNLTFDVAPTPIVFAGWTDFDGKLSYRLRTDAISAKLPTKAREILRELAIEVDDLADIRFEGSLDSLQVTFSGVPLEELKGQGPSREDRAKLREIGRKLRERLLR